MPSFLELLDRIRINVLLFFIPIGNRFIFWLRRKLNLTVTFRQVRPPFPDPDISETTTESSDGSIEIISATDQMTQTGIPAIPCGSNHTDGASCPRSYSDFIANLHRVSASSPPECAYLFRNQNFSYISDTDGGTPNTSNAQETDSD